MFPIAIALSGIERNCAELRATVLELRKIAWTHNCAKVKSLALETLSSPFFNNADLNNRKKQIPHRGHICTKIYKISSGYNKSTIGCNGEMDHYT